MNYYRDQNGTSEKRRNIAEKAMSVNGIPSIFEINPKLSRNFDIILHELAESQSELIEQNQRLKDARDKYFELYENAPAGYLTLSTSGIITEANSTIVRMLDFSKNDLLQNPFSRFIVYEDRAAFYTKFSKLQNGSDSINCNLRLFARNAVRIPAEIFCSQVKSALGKVNEYKMAVVEKNNTDMRWEIHSSEKELYKSMFWKNTSIGILLDADNGAVLYANPAACRFYGYKQDVFHGMNIREFDSSMDENQMHEYIHRTFAMKKELLNSSHRIVSGEIKDVEVHSTPLEIGNKKVILCMIHDVTERRELENQLFDYVAKLYKLNEELSRYVATLAKNVQAPLLAIRRYTNTLIRKLKIITDKKVPTDK